jgi:hypothetical protein
MPGEMTDRAEPHTYTDRRGRNLCDRCDKWQGSGLHHPTAPLPDEELAARCSATRQRVFDPALPPKQCPRRATHGRWCRQHAEILGEWTLRPPDYAQTVLAALRAERAARARVEGALLHLAMRRHDNSESCAGCADVREAVRTAWARPDLAPATGEGATDD